MLHSFFNRHRRLLMFRICFLTLYLMIVCIPLTWGVLSRTLSVSGSGWAWCADARAAL